MPCIKTWYCLKGYQIWSFWGHYFPAFGLIVQIYTVNLHIKHKYRKNRNSKNFKFWHCWRSERKMNWTYIGRPTAIEDVRKVVYITSFITIKGYLLRSVSVTVTSEKNNFFIKDFFSKCDHICSILRIFSHLLKKSLMENPYFT